MVETIEEIQIDNTTTMSHNIPVIFIEDRVCDDSDEVNEQIMSSLDHYSPSVRIVTIAKAMDVNGFGFLLSRSKFDPYPYVSRIDKESAASSSGLKEGDCVLEVSLIKNLRKFGKKNSNF